MATSRRNVDLVIRARDEGTKAFEAAVRALQSLNAAGDGVAGSATEASSRLQQLVAVATTVDRAMAQISAGADQATASIQRQQAVIAEQQAQLASLKGQAESAAQAIARIQGAIVDRVLAGGDTSDLITKLQAAKTAAATFDKEIVKLTGSIEREQAAITGSRSSLQQLGSTTLAAESTQAGLTAQIAAETAAMEQQAIAAGRLTQAEQARLAAARAAGDNDTVVAILNEVEARDLNIRKLKAEQQAATELAQIKDAQARAATLLPGDATTGLSARDSASVFSEAFRDGLEDSEGLLRANAAATKDMEAAAQRLRNQLNPLAVIEDRLNKELAEANALYKAGKISATELAQATNLLRANAQAAGDALGRQSAGVGKPRLFGLKPYELQNLSFQINDVFVGLASGQRVTQILAQQGLQITQIFRGFGDVMIRVLKNPAFLLIAAAIGTVTLGVRELAKEASRLRELEGALGAVAHGADVTAESLAEATDELDRFGLSAKDAIALTKLFLKEGVNPDRIVEFGEVAKKLAKITGKEVPEAAKDVAEAFTGGANAILKFDDTFDILTSTERDYVKDLFIQGRALEARNFAFEKLERKADEIERKMRGPWSEAAQALGRAWEALVEKIKGGLAVRATAIALEGLAVTVRAAANAIADLLNGNKSGFRGTSEEVDRLRANVKKLEEDLARLPEESPLTGGHAARQFDQRRRALENALSVARQNLADAEQRLAETEQRTADTRATGNEAEIEANKRLKADLDEIIVKDEKRSKAERIAAAERLAQREWERYFDQEHLKATSEAQQQEELQRRLIEARLGVEKDITREKEAQRRADDQAIKGFSQKVIGVESGGDPNAKNPLSTATGLGQFIESTWLDLFKRHFPDRAKELSDGAILALRRDGEISKKLIELYARENAAVLKKAGQSVTEANLFLTHFLGPDGAVKILKAAASTPVSRLLSPDAIAANRSVLGGKTAGEVRQFAADRFDDGSLVAIADVQARLNEIQKELTDSQGKFNAELDAEQAKLQRSINQYDARKGLIGEALIAVERQQAIEDAIFQREEDLKKINEDRLRQGKEALALTQAEKDELAELVGLEHDRANAQQRFNEQRRAVEQPVTDLSALRSELQQQIEFLRSQGLGAQADALTPQLDEVNQKLLRVIESYRQWLLLIRERAIVEGTANGLTVEQIDTILLRMENLKLSTQTLGTFMGVDLNQAAQRFAQGATTAFDRFAQGIAEGRGLITSLKDAFLQFAADFLRQIAQMIIQQYALNIALFIARMLGGGPAGGAPTGGSGSSFGVPVAHQGGVIGSGGLPTRTVDSAWFQNAMRYHGGGIAGLRPGEVPAILKRGEEVLTEDDPRHVGNGGGAGAPNIKNVVVFNPADVLSQGLSDQMGEQVFMTFVRRNRQAFQAALAS